MSHVKAAIEGRWPTDVSDAMQENIKEYLDWAKERKKSFAVPKHPPDQRCNWHTIAPNSVSYTTLFFLVFFFPPSYADYYMDALSHM